MYSPKIDDDLIPRIYQIAKQTKMPMTRWVNQILERAIEDQDIAHVHTSEGPRIPDGETPP